MGESKHTPGRLQIIFDGPPGPTAGRFVEAERDGRSLKAGEWSQRPDGLWALEIDPGVAAPLMLEVLREGDGDTFAGTLEGIANLLVISGLDREHAATVDFLRTKASKVRAAIKAATGGEP